MKNINGQNLNGLVQDRHKWLFRIIFFPRPSKVPEFLHVLFNLEVKHSLVFFSAGLHFASEKNEVKILKRAQWTHYKAEQEHFSQKKDTGECFSTKLKSTCKNSGTFEGKKTFTQKSHLRLSCTKPFNCRHRARN